MKKTSEYVFVHKKVYKKYINRCRNLLEPLVKELKKIGVKSKMYLTGSGGRHLVMQKVVNGEKRPFDLDFNLEIELDSLPKKFKDLKVLKDTVRTMLNKQIFKKDYFSDGQDSTSVISVPLHFQDDENQLQFSFDVAIVSRNVCGQLQRLIHNKKNNGFTWSLARDSKYIDEKADILRKEELWNDLRNRYKAFRNQFINSANHPAFICYIMTVEEIFCSEMNKKDGKLRKYCGCHLNPNWDPVGDSAEDD